MPSTIEVLPGRSSVLFGSCNSCNNRLVGQNRNPANIIVIEMHQMVFRLCESCAKDMITKLSAVTTTQPTPPSHV